MQHGAFTSVVFKLPEEHFGGVFGLENLPPQQRNITQLEALVLAWAAGLLTASQPGPLSSQESSCQGDPPSPKEHHTHQLMMIGTTPPT